MDDLLQQGITAYRAGRREEARDTFIKAVKQDPENELAWGWMYQISSSDRERIHCLKQMLRINPKNEKPARLLEQLLADLPPAPAAVPDNPPAAPGSKCPHCQNMIQEGAPRCSYCGRDIHEKKQAPEISTGTGTRLMPSIIGAVIAIIVCGLIYVTWFGVGRKLEPAAAPTRTPEENAWYACTLFIENQLKVSVLDAQGFTASGIILLDNGQYRVDIRYAKLATTYTCILLDHSGGNWELMSLAATRK